MSYHINKHRKFVHGCPVAECQMIFTAKSSLVRHMKRKHRAAYNRSRALERSLMDQMRAAERDRDEQDDEEQEPPQEEEEEEEEIHGSK